MKHLWKVLSLALAVCLCLTAVAFAEDGVTVTYVTSPLNAPSIVEKNGSWLENALGMPVNYAEITSGADQTAALASGDIDVTNAFTTDAQLAVADVVTLEDDLRLQVNYFCATVVREDALEKYPGLEDALKKMEGILTDQEMAALNYQVEVEERGERDVARAFLASKGLLEE